VSLLTIRSEVEFGFRLKSLRIVLKGLLPLLRVMHDTFQKDIEGVSLSHLDITNFHILREHGCSGHRYGRLEAKTLMEAILNPFKLFCNILVKITYKVFFDRIKMFINFSENSFFSALVLGLTKISKHIDCACMRCLKSRSEEAK
jgi:hypothetical protein